ncbi:efflux RND transporter permease subunit [Thalassospira sp. TSL5-1]|uniref:efflux RND transporter permease subunit n=1 Tax=Thalassospira sp. TSL5-1 TaxID=1544451 RepID=UPI00093E8E52|nr:efflux RND transporter permease subunit [Thalassospira sp. TSL5-1]OKH88368.1 acriflavin resistance protein [Thalassospira sp. TSL5-1]
MSLIDLALNRSRTVIMTLILLLVAGWVGYNAIPKEADPDVQIPILYVLIHHEGISPEDAERLLLRPMEQQLRTIEGVKEMRSQAYQGGASVTLEFYSDVNIDDALADVRERVDIAKSDLPDDTDDPEVHEVNLSLFPVLVVTLSGDVPERSLLRLARNLKDDIEGIPAVLEANLAGNREELVEFVIDPMKIESYRLRGVDIVSLVRNSNSLVAAGALDTGAGRFNIKVPGLFENVDDILNMPLLVDGDSVIRFRDIGEVRRTFKDATSFARLNGRPAIAIEVSKRVGENIIDVIDAVKTVTAEDAAAYPETVKVTYSQDKSSDIRTMLNDLQNSVILAILLVMVVVIWSLGWRSGLLVGLAIPGSFLTAILILWGLGMTVNIVVLFSLILAVGMLVDGAIVVTEYADRKMLDGMHRKQAYPLAAKRMAMPIIASTATTLAAFLPLAFWPDVVGDFMKFLPITVLFTLSASLAMALIFVPTVGAWFGKPGTSSNEALDAVAAGETDKLKKLTGGTGFYIRVLQKSLRVYWLIIPAAFVILIAMWMAFDSFGKGFEFFPSVEPENAAVQIRARGNMSYYEQDALVHQVEDRILALDDHSESGHHWFDTVYSRAGASAQGGGDSPEDVIGVIQLEYANWQLRPKASEIEHKILEATRDLAGIQVEIQAAEAGPPQGKDVQIQLRSLYPELLDKTSAEIMAGLQKIGGLYNFEDGKSPPGIDWEYKVDRAQALKFGADIATIGNTVKLVTNGILFSTYRPDDSTEEIDIVGRFPENRRTLEELQRLNIVTDKGLVPVSNFVTRTAEPKTGTLHRVDSRRALTVKADVTEGILVDTKVQEVKEWLKTLDIDPRVNVEFKGQDEEQQKSAAFLQNAFSAALFIMFIILVTQFNSITSSLLIMVAIIMSTAGVLGGLLLTGQPFSIVMNGIGIVALAGIVVNNNIVLIDTYDRLKLTADSIEDAILQTCAQRLRPVMLTTVTTILGLVPMVLQINIDFVTREFSIGAPSTQWWVQLATSIAFGLTFATVLTLVFTPCALLMVGRIGQRWQHWRNKRNMDRNDHSGPKGFPQ